MVFPFHKHTLHFLLIIIVSGYFYYSKENSFMKSATDLSGKMSICSDTIKLIEVTKNVQIRNYFQFLDSIISQYDSLTSYPLTEHLLVRANPWIIDTLRNTDYYRMKTRDSFVFNQKEMIVLRAGSTLEVPALAKAEKIISSFEKTYIDVNIPEFKLRIYEDSLLLHQFKIRVGRNEKKYLKMGARITDLRTIPGEGSIIGHVKNPDYYNPVNGNQYFSTRRDDNEVTKLPQIPFLETEINNVRNGQLIHPTTNPISLGKAYSNGCIGTSEEDAWVIYYHAPIGTKIIIRYHTVITDEFGEKQTLEDIYGYQKNKK